MPSFPEIMASQPAAFQNTTLATLMTSAQTLGSAWSLFQSVSNLTGSWGGSGQQAQSGQAGNLLGSGQQVMTALGQTQAMINSGSQQLQAAKVRLTAIVKLAHAEGFVVLPTGQVMLGPRQLAAISAHPGMAAYYHARQAMYNGQIHAVVLQSTAADIQAGLSLAKTGVDILNQFLHKNQNATTPASTVPPGTILPPTTIPGATTTPDQIGVGSSPTGLPPVGTGLAGVGALGGAVADPTLGGLAMNGAGPGSLGAAGSAGLSLGPAGAAGVGGLGARLGVTGLAGPGGGPGAAGPGLAGGGRTGPGMVAGMPGGRMGGGGTGMVGVGGTAAGGGRAGGSAAEEREARGWLLAEDEDPFGPGDVPDTGGGVLS